MKILLYLLFLPVLAIAETGPNVVLGASTGNWHGELYYLDYQSNQRFGIPMKIEAEMTPDGATLIRRMTYTDPGVQVYAVNLVTVDRDTGELVESYFRQGKGEYFRYEIEEVQFEDDQNWQLVYSHRGTDDDRPARLRHTL